MKVLALHTVKLCIWIWRWEYFVLLGYFNEVHRLLVHSRCVIHNLMYLYTAYPFFVVNINASISRRVGSSREADAGGVRCAAARMRERTCSRCKRPHRTHVGRWRSARRPCCRPRRDRRSLTLAHTTRREHNSNKYIYMWYWSVDRHVEPPP